MPASPHSAARRRIEWPTVLVAIAIYVGFGLLTWWHSVLWWPLVLTLGGYFLAWHGSLQHEVVHGHPTRWPRLNELLVLPSLWLWLPFRLYRASHLTHHSDDQLTDPRRDPESFYLTPERWARRGPVGRALILILNTAPGRLLLGPPVLLVQLAIDTTLSALRGQFPVQAWGAHALGVSLVLTWTLGVCEIALADYLLLYVWPGISLTLLRSFAEHEAHPDPAERTLAVETHPLLALLYLNNNLHPAHHATPHLPWYALPRCWRAQRAHARVLPGYGWLIAKHLIVPRIEPVWPLDDPAPTAPIRGPIQATRSR